MTLVKLTAEFSSGERETETSMVKESIISPSNSLIRDKYRLDYSDKISHRMVVSSSNLLPLFKSGVTEPTIRLVSRGGAILSSFSFRIPVAKGSPMFTLETDSLIFLDPLLDMLDMFGDKRGASNDKLFRLPPHVSGMRGIKEVEKHVTKRPLNPYEALKYMLLYTESLISDNLNIESLVKFMNEDVKSLDELTKAWKTHKERK